MRILVTGGAGFIGSHLCERLLTDGHDVLVIDNFNDFYDPLCKRRNIDAVANTANRSGSDFLLCEGDIRDSEFILELFQQEAPMAVIHLAAAAGVQPSIKNPLFYEEVNVRGTINILEGARSAGIRPILFVSSSSVYGNSSKTPFSESDSVDNPISPYAATKKAGELICHAYHHLHAMNIACLRFFTVYGPRQRPDLAIHKFIKLLDQGKPISLYGDGTTSRDYTFVSDIVDGLLKALLWVCNDERRYDIFNLGGSRPVELRQLVELIENALCKTAQIERMNLQPGDVLQTWADLTKSNSVLGYAPETTIEEGIAAFVRWHRKPN